MATPSIEWSTFSGSPSDDVTLFLQSVKRVAFAQGRHKDDEWVIDYLETCLTGSAMGWFLQLDEPTSKSWKLLQRAFLAHFASNSSQGTQAPMPAAAAPPPVGARGSVRRGSTSSTGWDDVDSDSAPAPLPSSIFVPYTISAPQVIKFMLLGDQGVGKSSLFARCTGGGWPAGSHLTSNSSSPTFNYESHARTLMPSGRQLSTYYWDPRGHPTLPGESAVLREYLDGINGVYLIYDITSLSSFKSIRKWFAEARQYCSADVLAYLIVGNKLDLAGLPGRRAVTAEQGELLAAELEVVWGGEVSAKTNDGIDTRLRRSSAMRSEWVDSQT